MTEIIITPDSRPPSPALPSLNPHVFLNDFCEIADISLEDIKSTRRYRVLVQPRMMAMILIENNFPRLSLGFIGDMFNRDHSTVLHAIKTVKNLVQTDQTFKEDYYNITYALSVKYNREIKC